MKDTHSDTEERSQGTLDRECHEHGRILPQIVEFLEDVFAALDRISAVEHGDVGERSRRGAERLLHRQEQAGSASGNEQVCPTHRPCFPSVEGRLVIHDAPVTTDVPLERAVARLLG
jgi:hypothetical protein